MLKIQQIPLAPLEITPRATGLMVLYWRFGQDLHGARNGQIAVVMISQLHMGIRDVLHNWIIVISFLLTLISTANV